MKLNQKKRDEEMSLETKEESRQAEYEFEYKKRLREFSISRLTDAIYNVTNKTQDRELKEILIDFIIENNLEVE